MDENIPSYVDLHLHTGYSLLDSNGKIKEIVARAKELGRTACAITDHGVMFGCIAFYHVCKDAGIKPILGCEVYVAPKTVEDRDKNNKYHHLVLLAETLEGFHNLQKISTMGYTKGFYSKPRVDDQILAEYHNGIIALSACLAGRIPRLITAGKYDEAKTEALKYRDLFGESNFFLEIQDHNDNDEKLVAQQLYRMSKETGIPLVATNDCHYVRPEDAEAHEILLYMQRGHTIENESPEYGNGQLYIKSEAEMRALFPYAPEAIENTGKIAERCNVEIKFHETKMPKAPVPEGMTSWQYINALCDEGFKERYPNDDGSQRKQLDYELGVIEDMGYTDYFIIVREFCQWAKDHGIALGKGRGSAAGSVATYCMGITDLDPSKYGLAFERFLGKHRLSMPDIDQDIDNVGRPAVIEHVRELYGRDNVCQIITFGTLAAKQSVKDVGKVLGYEVAYYNKLASYIPSTPGITLKKALEESVEFKIAYNSDDDAKKIIDTAMKLEGLPRNTSTHAAGVIISRLPVQEYIPLALTKDGELCSQYNMVEIEELGLLKMDFLGLRTLTVETESFKNIQRTTGKIIDSDSIPLDDPEVYDFIGTGKTSGIFQLESAGMQNFMRQLKPKCIEDVIAGIALYRPGPMDFIPKYIAGKNDPDTVTYACDELRPILENTYGCIVYQEQVMQIFQHLAGYSLGGADNIRRAMSKKKQYVIDENREIFIHGGDLKVGEEMQHIPGCLAKGISESAANEIYDSMTDFAKYAFNKSHAACYALITVQTAWLKNYYPAEFLAANATVFTGDADKLPVYMNAAKDCGINILRPDVNISTDKFISEKEGIRVSLSAIKGVGASAVEGIIRYREEHGAFTNFIDFMDHAKEMDVDKKAIEGLIKSGALDNLGQTRNTYLCNYEFLLSSIAKANKDVITGQMSLFDYLPIPTTEKYSLVKLTELEDKQKLTFEKEVTGFYISGHPLDTFKPICDRISSCRSSDFVPAENEALTLREKQEVILCGMIAEGKRIYTKKGDSMAILTLEDLYGSAKVVIFPKLFDSVSELLEDDALITIKGRVSIPDEDDKPCEIIADNVYPFDSLPFTLWIRVDNKNSFLDHRKSFINIAKNNPGKGRLRVYVNETKKISDYPDKVALAAFKLYSDVFGDNNVKLT